MNAHLASRSPAWDTDPPLWRLLLDPRGRMSRLAWWTWGVALPLGLGLLMFLLLGIARVRADAAEQLINLVLVWPTAVVAIKRWHDIGRSGWWVLVVLLPLVGWAWALWSNGVLRGTAGPNAYGADPLEAAPWL